MSGQRQHHRAGDGLDVRSEEHLVISTSPADVPVEPAVFGTVADLIATPPLIVPASTAVSHIARLLTERPAPCAIIDVGDGTFGLVGDATLRRGVVAAELPATTPGSEVMEHPAPTIDIAETAAEALVALLDTRFEHLVVVDRSGRLRGVVDAGDFMVSPTTSDVGLIEQIRRARTPDELIRRARTAPDMLGHVIRRGLATSRAATVYSALVDAIVRRSIELVFAARDDLTADAFTWLSLGSNGRREAVPSSDVDAAVAFAGTPDPAEIRKYRRAFDEVNTLLLAAGLRIDTHGANPANEPFARTNQQWRQAATRWLTAPSDNKGAIMASLLVDARPIHGDPGLPEVAQVFGDLRRHPATMEALLTESLSHRAKARSVRGLLTGKGDSFNVKVQGLVPVINIARWAALGVGSTELNTVKRLHETAGSTIMPVRQARRLIEVFDVLQDLRMRHQLGQLERGLEPTDVIDREELSPIERRTIGQAVREITSSQRRMDRVAQYTPTESWIRTTASASG